MEADMSLQAVTGTLLRFCANRRGGVTVMFTIALIPMFAMIAAGIEYSRVNATAAKMQDALDAAALMAAKDASNLSAADLQTEVGTFFAATFRSLDVSSVRVSAAYNSGSTNTLNLSAWGTVDMTFMKIFGRNGVDVKVSNSIALNSGARLRVAL